MIEFNNVTRYYGRLRALNQVSFSVQKGEIVGLLGLNGAGKSTALKILAGLLPPSSGSVTIDGMDVSEAADSFLANIGFLSEDPPLYRDMTVTAFLTHIGQLKGMRRADVVGRLPEVIRMTGLKGREHQVIGTLSHGFQKRVGIGMAVLHNPRLVILDEPISGLDPRQIKDMRDVIRKLGDGRSVLISSHILSEISKTCDRIVVLHDGELVGQGTQDELARAAGGARLAITIRGEQQALLDWLEGQEQVESTKANDAEQPYASALVELKDAEQRSALLGALVGAGFALWRVEDAAYGELESVFLGLTRGGGSA